MKVEWKDEDGGKTYTATVGAFSLSVYPRSGNWYVDRGENVVADGTNLERTAAQRAAERALTKLIEDAVKAKEIAG